MKILGDKDQQTAYGIHVAAPAATENKEKKK
jgi:hypothetical protein